MGLAEPVRATTGFRAGVNLSKVWRPWEFLSLSLSRAGLGPGGRQFLWGGAVTPTVLERSRWSKENPERQVRLERLEAMGSRSLGEEGGGRSLPRQQLSTACPSL